MNKNLRRVTIIIAALVAIFFICCKSNKSITQCKSVTFVINIKIPLRNGVLHTMKDSANIFYYGKFKFYEMPYYYEATDTRIDKSGNVLSETLNCGTKYRYVVSNKEDKYGMEFDSINDAKPTRIPIDSFVNATIYPQIPYYHESNDILLNVVRKKSGNVFFENHISRVKKDSSFCDTIRYTFDDRLKDREFSFARKLDSTRKSKLVKVEFITNPTMMYGFKFPKRISRFEIRDNKVDPVKIQALIDNYQKITGKQIDF